MILSAQNIPGILLGTIFICCQAQDSCPDVKLMGVGEPQKVAILRGHPGTPGHPGSQGPLGSQGFKGDQGDPGKTGDRGLTGQKGDAGVPGAKGKLGQTGLKGDQGAQGKTGEKGLKGAKGDQGAPGRTGDKGQNGEKGDLGAPGRTGDKGPTGQKGEPGASGTRGDKGQTGEKGSKGEKAYQGAKDCKELRDQGVVFDGWYTIYPDGMQPLMVLCDMTTDGGGWIVFQRRADGSIDFYQDWQTYKSGFGSQLSEFWLGNENIHRLTSGGNFQLRVDLEDFNYTRAYATYSDFSITGEGDLYRLKVGTYTGTAGDSLSQHNNVAFSTKDRRNDTSDKANTSCAEYYIGAWWFYKCYHSHLNGKYLKGENTDKSRGVIWVNYRVSTYSLKSTEMKFRPVKK